MRSSCFLTSQPHTTFLPSRSSLSGTSSLTRCSRWALLCWLESALWWRFESAGRGKERVAMLKTPDWEMMIVVYFFLGGIAGGSYFTAAIADNFGGPKDRQVVRMGYWLSLPLVAICGILLIADLGVPARFLNILFTFKFWDPMSIGAWMVGVFGLFSFLSCVLSLSSSEAMVTLRRKVSLVGTLAGFFLASYTGVLLSATALPFWSEARLMGALFLASGASTG